MINETFISISKIFYQFYKRKHSIRKLHCIRNTRLTSKTNAILLKIYKTTRKEIIFEQNMNKLDIQLTQCRRLKSVISTIGSDYWLHRTLYENPPEPTDSADFRPRFESVKSEFCYYLMVFYSGTELDKSSQTCLGWIEKFLSLTCPKTCLEDQNSLSHRTLSLNSSQTQNPREICQLHSNVRYSLILEKFYLLYFITKTRPVAWCKLVIDGATLLYAVRSIFHLWEMLFPPKFT